MLMPSLRQMTKLYECQFTVHNIIPAIIYAWLSNINYLSRIILLLISKPVEDVSAYTSGSLKYWHRL